MDRLSPFLEVFTPEVGSPEGLRCSKIEAVTLTIEPWRDGRVVECARLEIECCVSNRGFESLSLRFNFLNQLQTNFIF